MEVGIHGNELHNHSQALNTSMVFSEVDGYHNHGRRGMSFVNQADQNRTADSNQINERDKSSNIEEAGFISQVPLSALIPLATHS